MGEPKEIGITQAARILGVHPNTLRKWADDGLVPYIRRPSGHRRFSVEKLKTFRDEMEHEPGKELAAQNLAA